jgi:hypothetical protein
LLLGLSGYSEPARARSDHDDVEAFCHSSWVFRVSAGQSAASSAVRDDAGFKVSL